MICKVQGFTVNLQYRHLSSHARHAMEVPINPTIL